MSVTSPDNPANNPSDHLPDPTEIEMITTAKMAATAPEENDEIPTAKMPAPRHAEIKKRKRRPYSKRRRIITLVALAIVLAVVLVPAGFLIAYGVSGYQTYTELKNQAHDGVDHLLNVKTIFTGVKTHPTGFLEVVKLTLARQQLSAAQVDFVQLEYKIAHIPIIQMITSHFPQLPAQVQTARAASRIGYDATQIGQELVSTALIIAPTFRGPLLTNSSQPLVTHQMLDLVGTTITDLLT